MHTHLKRYLEFIHAKANTDALTHVGNTTAYMDAQSELEGRMEEGKRFAIAVFDINDLKKVNDRFGHKEGDRIIQGAAEGICSIFGSDHTYRIGGDEFTAVMEDGTDEAIRHKVQRVREAVMKFNEGSDTEGAKLSLSAGTAEFDPEHDKKFRDVFVRADEVLYQKKREYHRRHSE